MEFHLSVGLRWIFFLCVEFFSITSKTIDLSQVWKNIHFSFVRQSCNLCFAKYLQIHLLQFHTFHLAHLPIVCVCVCEVSVAPRYEEAAKLQTHECEPYLSTHHINGAFFHLFVWLVFDPTARWLSGFTANQKIHKKRRRNRIDVTFVISSGK